MELQNYTKLTLSAETYYPGLNPGAEEVTVVKFIDEDDEPLYNHIEIFVEFLKGCGYLKKSIYNRMREYLEEEDE